MKTWADFVDLMRSSIMGPPDPLMEDYVKRTVIDFAGKTHVLRDQAEDVEIKSGESSYELIFVNRVVPVYIIHVKHGNKILYETSENELESLNPDWRLETGSPTHRFQTPDNKLVLFPVPDADDDNDMVITTCVVKPALNATGVDDTVYDEYGLVIAEGALAELKRIPNKPWTDPAGAAAHFAFYKRGISEARKKVLKSRGLRSQSVNPRVFGGVV